MFIGTFTALLAQSELRPVVGVDLGTTCELLRLESHELVSEDAVLSLRV